MKSLKTAKTKVVWYNTRVIDTLSSIRNAIKVERMLYK